MRRLGLDIASRTAVAATMRKVRLLTTFVVAIIVGGGVTSAGAFDSAHRLVVAQATEKLVGQGEGVVKGVDASERKVLIKHGPITGTLQMSGMTMAFGVAPEVDLSGLASGAKVKFTLSRDAKGLYVIEQIRRD